MPSPLGTKNAGEDHSVGLSHGTMMPEAIYLEISAFEIVVNLGTVLAGSWKRRGIGRGADTLYGIKLSLRYIFIFCVHIGLLSSVSENTSEKADNVFVFKSL